VQAVIAQLGGIKTSVKKIDDSALIKEYLDEETKLTSNPKYGSLYDKEKIRSGVITKAQKEGRYFKPDEELASKKAQAVEGAASPTIKGSKKEFTYNDLTEDQKYWANKYEKLGLYTKKQYIDELMKTGALK
jgi:hypothetical protein